MGQSVDLRVLTAEEFGPFRQRNIARYAQELLFARATDTEEHALTEAQGALDEMLPQGADTPRNYLLAAESGGETVGELWCDTTEPETVFINDFFVYPACRGHGWYSVCKKNEDCYMHSERLYRNDHACLVQYAIFKETITSGKRLYIYGNSDL